MDSNGPPHIAEQMQNDQLEHTYSSYLRIRRPAGGDQRLGEVAREGHLHDMMMMMMMMMIKHCKKIIASSCGGLGGVVVNVQSWYRLVSEFKLKSGYYIDVQIKTIGKGMNSSIEPAII